jgi:DNA adenine methylase
MMLEAVRDGWNPPKTVSEKLYADLRNAEPSALRAFVGFSCSFYGKFFGGYARARGQDFPGMAGRSLIKLRPDLQGVRFKNQTYDVWNIESDVIYADPPYKGSTEFDSGEFDHDCFWKWVRARSKKSVVLISEYQAPDDFKSIWETPYKTTMRTAGKGIARVEKLFTLA